MKNTILRFALVPLLLAACSCRTPIVPAPLRSQVTPGVTFKQVLANPEQYNGDTVLWGGAIL